jgi:probable F420-dependent oxidoreductase
VRIGLNILNFGPGANPDGFLRWAQTAESLAYHGVFISDHVAVTPRVAEHYPEPFFDPFEVLGWLAGQTSAVDLGTTVCVVPYRSPMLTARLGANLDRLSGGRFVFGAGAGWGQEEYAALGLPYSRRGRMTDECLEAIVALWTGKGPVSFDGRLVRFDAVAAIAPHQEPRPPIWIGGASEAALRRTARLGDAWHPILASVDRVAPALESIRRQARELGRAAPAFAPRIRIDVRDVPDDARALGVGTLEQVRDDLARLQNLGAEYVVLDWNSRDLDATRDHERGLALVTLLAEQVFDLPREELR